MQRNQLIATLRSVPGYLPGLLLLIAGAGQLLATTAAQTPVDSPREPLAVELKVSGAIGPASLDYLKRSFAKASLRNAGLIIIRLDTPGGLDSSMRDINQLIIDSSIPVAIHVAPAGARAASAGTYMLYAAHVAAMTPGTNLGAATPVQMGGGGSILPKPDEDEAAESEQAADEAADPDTGNGEKTAESESADDSDAMTRKVVNDAAAYIRGLAELRGRNADWAEKAVREAVSLSASEAKEKNVIDFIAADTRSLLNEIDGFEVEVRGQSVTLDTAGMQVEVIDPDWRTELLGVITNPNIIYLLMLLGFYGLIFELANPGNIFPGVVGAICLLLALYAVQVLPVNYAGVALIALGVAFMVGELFMPSFGALGIGGLIAFVIGSIIMFDPASTGYQVSLWLIGASAALTALFIMAAIGLMLKSHRRAVTTGSEEMLTAQGRVLEDFSGNDVYTGRVFIHGETWQAHSQHKLTAGQGVRVISRDGLKLEVEAVTEEQAALET